MTRACWRGALTCGVWGGLPPLRMKPYSTIATRGRQKTLTHSISKFFWRAFLSALFFYPSKGHSEPRFWVQPWAFILQFNQWTMGRRGKTSTKICSEPRNLEEWWEITHPGEVDPSQQEEMEIIKTLSFILPRSLVCFLFPYMYM